MTRQEYIATIAKLYRIANNSDTDQREAWINEDACATHCQAFDLIIRDLCSDPHEFEHALEIA